MGHEVSRFKPHRLQTLAMCAAQRPRLAVPAGASDYLAEPARAVAPHAIAADGAALGWLKWPLLAAVVLAFGYCMLNRDPGQAIASTMSAR